MNHKNSFKLREIIILALMSAVLCGVQVAIAFLPNVELVSLLIIIYTLIFGYKVFFIIGVFVFIEGLTYGFGIWWISYLYIWTILAIITLFFKRNQMVILWAFISGLFGLMFGFLCSFPYVFIGGPQMAFSYWISGILFDIIHCVFNFLIVLILFKPVLHMLTRLYAPFQKNPIQEYRKISSDYIHKL